MDRIQIQETIRRIETEMEMHDLKFADNPQHNNCRVRFIQVLENLQVELAKKLTMRANDLNFDPNDGQDVLNFSPGESRFPHNRKKV